MENGPRPRAPDARPTDVVQGRVVRVFISSTFKDMIADRDTLMAQTWPALRKLCRERAVELVEVNLRWGITEAQSQRKETVRYCLAEIKRCRPYFIGLIGERYGWGAGADVRACRGRPRGLKVGTNRCHLQFLALEWLLTPSGPLGDACSAWVARRKRMDDRHLRVRRGLLI